MILELIILCISATFALVSFINLISYPVLESKQGKKSTGTVSVLIPCRNEEKNIKSLLESLEKQTYKSIEIIVYDDQSTDTTPRILNEYKKKLNLQVITGTNLPKGWLGKNYACHQLSKKATGDYLCFIDADVQLAPQAIEQVINIHKGGLLSVFPRQIKKTFGERLVVPLLNWLALSLLPFFTIQKVKEPRLVAANGQFMCFSRKAYQKIGGHKAVAKEVVEDINLAKQAKKKGELVQTFVSTKLISCRMYTSFQEGISGFSKNFFAGFGMSRLVFSLFLLVMTLGLIGPFIIISSQVGLLALSVLIMNSICVRLVDKDLVSILLFPLHSVIFIALGIISMNKKEKTWKGRTV